MTREPGGQGSLARYTHASALSSAQIIASYSTSFGLATRLLGSRRRAQVRNIYALVRVADELVDGVTAEAGLTPDQQRRALDRLEEETERAIASGYSSNPIVHAFAGTARSAGIRDDLTRPFFSSMRADLTVVAAAESRSVSDVPQLVFGEEEHTSYVYGSAEVVGLMCLRVFLRDESVSTSERRLLEHGARQLGAAFQNVNFLRDLAEDTHRLGRSYLSEDGRLDSQARDRWVAVIRQQLSDARSALALLPGDARRAVGCALLLFSRLTDRIAETPVDELYRRRVRVSAPEKLWLVARAVCDARRGSAR